MVPLATLRQREGKRVYPVSPVVVVMQATKDYKAISIVAHDHSHPLGTFVLGHDVCHHTHGRWEMTCGERALKEADNNKACRRCDQQEPDICRREVSQ